ncbi:MAG: hypothetical protein JSU93_03585 [Methanobacteriota archaeon]|nr:MAG: hypothetical protein JSU93_03585 [Euryarchaeota archaeon]
MPDDLRRSLKKLTVSQMKSIAEAHGIDVSICTAKKAFVDVLASSALTENDVREFLSKGNIRDSDATDMKNVQDDLERISAGTGKPKDVDDANEMNIERSIDQALLLRPLFYEIDSATEHAWNKMILGDFSEALRLNTESRGQVIERLATYHLYSTALSLRAAETLMWEMKDLIGESASELKVALAEAKMAFMNGPPKRREETLEEVEKLTSKAVQAFREKSSDAERELRQMLQDYASFGVRVDGASEMLDIAANAKSSKDFGQYSVLLNEARMLAAKEKGARMREFESAFEQVRSAIDAAKEAGVDTKKDEAQFRDAKKAFKKSDFKAAMELLSAVERAADSAHLQKVREDDGVKAKEIEQISSSVRMDEPDLQEAAMYGMDVQEGLLFVRQAKTALERSDVVVAAKYSRRAHKLTKSMEEDLKRMRAERGIVNRLEGGSCGECGREALYTYPDGTTRCDECGHTFSTAGGAGTMEDDSDGKKRRLKGFLGR